MSRLTRKLLLIASVVLVLLLPIPGAFLKWGGWPPGFGIFPPQQFPGPTPGFSLPYFLVGCAVVLVMLAFYLVPAWFGFRASPRPAGTEPESPAPWWHYLGLAVMVPCWLLMWFGPEDLAKWTFVPLWWGFIVALDGLVFKRAGTSLMVAWGRRFVMLSLMSVLGWYLFEYLNYFVLENWYYPNNKILSPRGNVIWFTLAYTTVWPAIAEWYTLLLTFPALRRRWQAGPAIQPRAWIAVATLLAGAAMLALVGGLPFLLFFTVWIGPMVLLAGALACLGFWTPFRPIGRGDWSRVALAGLASLLTGFFWEGWNYGSQFFRDHAAANPNYWIYEIPYVNVIHVFSNMPLLGYFGYPFFGLLAWVWWLVCAHLFGYPHDFGKLPPPRRDP